MIVGALLQMLFSQKELFAFFNTHYTGWLDPVMYYVTCMGTGQVITALLLLLMILPPFRNWWFFITATLCNLVPFLLQQWLKSYFDCPRPLNYFHQAHWIHFSADWPELFHRSFPSGHSEGAFSFFCFLSLLLTDKNKKLGILFFILAIGVCYSRMYLAAHFFEDVYAGSLLGGAVTTVIFSIMNKYRDRIVWKRGKNR